MEFNKEDYLALQKLDKIEVEFDFTPMDGINNIVTSEGIFIKHATGLPAGWLPNAYVLLENGFVGWLPAYSLSNGKKMAVIRLIEKNNPDIKRDELFRWSQILISVSEELDQSIVLIRTVVNEMQGL